MFDHNQHLHITRNLVPSIQSCRLITPCLSKQDHYRQDTFAKHCSQFNERLPMIAGSVYTKVLPVKTLAAHSNSTTAGPDTKSTAHVLGKFDAIWHYIYSLNVVPEPIDVADTFTPSLLLHLSADQAPATAIGADDQRLSPYLPLHPVPYQHRQRGRWSRESMNRYLAHCLTSWRMRTLL